MSDGEMAWTNMVHRAEERVVYCFLQIENASEVAGLSDRELHDLRSASE